ncbi:MAG: substrate-binding domain-containing protein, partial [Verrucomicrobiota bacterium]
MTKLRIAIAIDLEWPVSHHHDVVRGILQFAGKKPDWHIIVDPFVECQSPGAHGGEPSYAGVIARATTELAEFLQAHAIPGVNVWLDSPDRSLPRVLPDQNKAGAMACEHLVERGFKNFGFLGMEADGNTVALRDGFESVLPRSEHTYNEEGIDGFPRSGEQWIEVKDKLNRWLDTWMLPVGVLTTDDIIGRYLVNVCLERGLKVPDDVALIGCGNYELACNSLEPTLSSIDYGYARIGYRAAETLDRILEGERHTPPVQRIPPEGLFKRRSTEVAAMDDPLVASALRFIWDHAHEPILVDDVVRVVPASRRVLERRFRRSNRASIHQEITRARIEQAKRRLVESEAPIGTIANLVGYATAEHFIRIFRESTGKTPRQYRLR